MKGECDEGDEREDSGHQMGSVGIQMRILTKSSKPRSVPRISLSDFIMMWMREPIHLSTNSGETMCKVSLAVYELYYVHVTFNN